MKSINIILVLTILISVANMQCSRERERSEKDGKIVIYQVLPRLFGNTTTNNKPWGTIEENGVGKFSDFTDDALAAIKDLGVTHIWYTGVLHHCVINDYAAYGISPDDPDIVKGRAGSPYAVKDYYNVNPDLADDPARRLEEFEALIERTHARGLKVIIDIVPNHVARNYHSITNPEGIVDFGYKDDTTVVYRKDNNFYYIPGTEFIVPEWTDAYLPLGGEAHEMSDGKFREIPAKWTGNGSRNPQPHMYDWYETVKVNFGVDPEGNKDFDELPPEYAGKDCEAHFEFWKEKDVPDSWMKFRQIAHYWLAKGVDGFRYDMSQMVPVEFWSYLNSSIKTEKPGAVLISEIYVPEIYRDYIHLGKMDYLYDKVELYDTLKHIIQGHGSTDNLSPILRGLQDIEHHMLHFLENHDEHRLASPEFAGSAEKGFPAMVLSATIGTSPSMIYFGQEVGEKGEGDAGYGKTGRTTIFDYWGVPAHQRWMNQGKFDGGLLTEEEAVLREKYTKLLNYVIKSEVLTGELVHIHDFNRQVSGNYTDKQFSFIRSKANKGALILSNFNDQEGADFELRIPQEVAEELGLRMGRYRLQDALGSGKRFELLVTNQGGAVMIHLDPLESLILEF